MAAFKNTDDLLTEDITLPAATVVDIEVDEAGKGIETDVKEYGDGMLYLFVKGDDAASAGTVIITPQISPNGDDWFDLPPRTVTLNGVAIITDPDASLAIDFSAVTFFRIGLVENTDPAETVTFNAGLKKGLKG